MKISWNEKQECIIEPETPEEAEALKKQLAVLNKEYEDWDKEVVSNGK